MTTKEIQKPWGRRAFLSSLSILGVGLTAGGFRALTSAEKKKKTDVNALWMSFCDHFDASAADFQEHRAAFENVEACPGHSHVDGKPVYLKSHQVIAIPCWIYWGDNTHTPSDLLVKIISPTQDIQPKVLNRFQLQLLCEGEFAERDSVLQGVLTGDIRILTRIAADQRTCTHTCYENKTCFYTQTLSFI